MKRSIKIDLTLSILAAIASFFLSWPYWRDFEYWAESKTMWGVYFVVGFILAVYVFYVFIDCLRILFLHDELLKKGVIKPEPNDLFDAQSSQKKGDK